MGLAHKFTSANYPIPGEVFDTYGDAVADKVAAFTMPAAYYDVYIAKGKPGGCLDLEAYTYTTVEGVVTLLFIGSIEIDRATGKPKWQNINFLLYGPNGEIFFATSGNCTTTGCETWKSDSTSLVELDGPWQEGSQLPILCLWPFSTPGGSALFQPLEF